METNFWIDLLIGAALVNAIPHYILAIWNARMVSGFGIGRTQNLLWALVNLLLSAGLFLYQYGLNGLREQAIYSGAMAIAIVFIVVAPVWHRILHKRQ